MKTKKAVGLEVAHGFCLRLFQANPVGALQVLRSTTTSIFSSFLSRSKRLPFLYIVPNLPSLFFFVNDNFCLNRPRTIFVGKAPFAPWSVTFAQP